METLHLGAYGTAAGQGAEFASLELKTVAFELRVDNGLKKLEGLIGKRVRSSSWGPSKAHPHWRS